MWTWDVASAARATSGFTAVLKKCGFKQRKLLMACATNYAMADPRKKSNLGMMGAQALTSVHTEGEDCQRQRWMKLTPFLMSILLPGCGLGWQLRHSWPVKSGQFCQKACEQRSPDPLELLHSIVDASHIAFTYSCASIQGMWA